jgi:hypothetical protein
MTGHSVAPDFERRNRRTRVTVSSLVGRATRFLIIAIGTVIGVCAVAWTAGALYFDLPAPAFIRETAAGLWLVGVIILWFLVRPRLHARVFTALVFTGIFTWWLTLKPRQDRDWKPEVAVLAHADIDGDQVIIHNVRDFDYRTETEFTPRYEARAYDVGKLRGIDLFLCYWGFDLAAHPILSFDFGDEGRIAFSIEARQQKGEGYSPVGGLYRRFELIYIPGEERDLVRVRTNFRKNQDVYLYKLNITPERASQRFLQYLAQLNELYAHPRWYNAFATNCTTSIRYQHAAKERAPWDWRILANGKVDEMLYEQDILDRSFPFAELKRRARINQRALVATHASDFSDQIRVGIPGYQ